MSPTYELFRRFKAARHIDADSQGAAALGLERATVSAWKSGRNADASRIEAMAEAIGESPALWVALVEADRAEKAAKPAEARTWRRLAERIAAVAAMLVLSVAVVTFPGTTHARDTDGGYRIGTPYTLCALRRRLARALRALRARVEAFRWTYPRRAAPMAV